MAPREFAEKPAALLRRGCVFARRAVPESLTRGGAPTGRFGPRLVVHLQEAYGAKVYYNTMVRARARRRREAKSARARARCRLSADSTPAD